MLYLVGIFDLWDGVKTLGLTSALAYVMAAFIQDPTMPWIAFFVLMGHMSVSHIYRQARNEPHVVDVTGMLYSLT
jgi:lysophospholipid acyltransferase